MFEYLEGMRGRFLGGFLEAGRVSLRGLVKHGNCRVYGANCGDVIVGRVFFVFLTCLYDTGVCGEGGRRGRF